MNMSEESSPLARVQEPPLAERRPHLVPSPHGARNDDYYWLRDDTREDEDMLAYLKAENAYTKSMLEPVADLQEKLYEELVGRMQQDDSSPPVRRRGFWYRRSVVEGKEYPIYSRAPLDAPDDERILLDVNDMAEGHTYFNVATQRVSPNNKLLAFGEDAIGRRRYTIRIKDLESGEWLADRIENTTSALVWGDDNRTLFYVEKDPVTLLGVRVKRHILGTDCSEDTLVYEEKDSSFYMYLGRSSDRKFLLLYLSSTVSDEVRYLPADRPEDDFKVFEQRGRTHEYELDHIADRWIIRTNWNASNFRLMGVDDADSGSRDNWREVVGHSPEVYIGGFTLFDDYIVISERSDGLQRLRIRRWTDGQESFVRSDEAAYSANAGENPETATDWLRYGYTSLTTPSTTYELNMKTGERRLLKQQQVGGGFDPANYRTERRWATARDGARVPVSIVYHKETALDGTAPLYQYSYGSYGSSSDPRFQSGILSLLDRGFVYAIAHVRGGQEMGRAWYEDGKLLNKKNTFTDFIDVTEFLLQSKCASPDKVVIAGGSAGGLLMGAVANMRPDLYRV
ncbi:MAG: oligopeptidase B, partial [Gammaproteobacteria bacterium]